MGWRNYLVLTTRPLPKLLRNVVASGLGSTVGWAWGELGGLGKFRCTVMRWISVMRPR